MRPNIQKNQSVECVISGYTSVGEGVAKISFEDATVGDVRQFPLFVKGALIGEKARVKIVKVARKCAWGRIEEILETSTARIEPDCPYYKKCGSCTLRHMTYDEECKFKEQKVNDALHRLGHLDCVVEKFYFASTCEAYRNKTAFAVSRAKNGNIDIGLYYERSHDICNIHNCALQSKSADNALNVVRKWANKHSIRSYDEKTGHGLLRHVVLRTNAAGDILVCLVCTRDTIEAQAELIDTLEKKIPGFAGLVLNVNKDCGNVILGNKNICLYGNSYIYEEFFDLRFRLDITSFFQVNLEQTIILYSQIIEFGQFTSNDKILDLYCGVGSISLCVAKYAGQVYGVEINPNAIKNAKENARLNKIENVHFACADAGEFHFENIGEIDKVIVDPPRKGLERNVIDKIIDLNPKNIIYVSCDPATLARDLSIFTGEADYTVQKANAVDMFPRTNHVESIVALTNSCVL